MIKGKTSGGFEFEIDGSVLDDKEQRKRLYDFLRGDDGRVHITAVSDCIREVMDAIGDAGKN